MINYVEMTTAEAIAKVITDLNDEQAIFMEARAADNEKMRMAYNS